MTFGALDLAATARLYLVRHGQTHWNASGRAQGHTDIALDDVGREQAARVATAVARMGARVDEVWSSDLARSRDTAATIARTLQLDVIQYRELRERSFGEWEGQQLADIRLRIEALAKERGARAADIRPPGGESLDDVWQRLDPITERLREAARTIVLVSHGGLSSILLARLIAGTAETVRSFRSRNASITELERNEYGGFRLIKFDDISHL